MVRTVTPYAAQRLRFGILAARHMYARDAMTADQIDYLEGCVCAGWRIRDSLKAFRRECQMIAARRFRDRRPV